MASCKTYGQKPLVNDRGLSLGSMHGVVGLKFSSLINSDLTWKKAAKGNRTSSRRARNSVSRSWNSGEDLIKMDSNTVDMSFSESEKLGVSVLGCRFSENADHVPIKKRKLKFKSPSLSFIAPSQHLEENERLLRSQPGVVDYAASASDLGQTVDIELDDKEKNLEKENKQLNEMEDFSGIFILAAAACRDSFGEVNEEGSEVEVSYVREGSLMKNQLHPLPERNFKDDLSSAKVSSQETGFSISMVHSEKLPSSLRMYEASTDDILQANNVQNKSMGDCSMAVVKDHLTKNFEETDGVCGFSSQDDRSFWDLNTSMDAWSCPVDDQCAESNSLDGIIEDVKGDNCSNIIGSSESGSMTRGIGGIRCHTEMELPPADPGGMVHEEKFVDGISCCGEKLSSSVSVDSVTVSVDRNKSASAQCLTFSPTSNSKCLSAHQIAELNSSEHNPQPSKTIPSLSTSISKAICDAGSSDGTSVKNEGGCGSIACETVSSGLQVEEVDLAPSVTSSVNTICKTDVLNEDSKCAKENSLSQFNDVEFLPSSCIDVEIQTLNGNVFEHDETDKIEYKEVEELVTKSSEMSTALSHIPSDAYQKSSKDIVNSFDNMAVEEPSDNGYNSESSHDAHACMKASRCEVDYDSQYEDGEVRESMEHTWQEHNGEHIEATQPDYSSDNENSGSAAEKIMTNTHRMDFKSCLSKLRGKDVINVVKTGCNNYSKFSIGDKEITDDRTYTRKEDSRIRARNDNVWKNDHTDGAVGPDAVDQTRVAESRKFRREFCSHIEERAFSDIHFRRDRGRYGQDPHARSRGDDRSTDPRASSRGLKHHRSTEYRVPASFHHRGRTKGLHHRVTRSRSPDARDEVLGRHQHIRSSRNLSPGWHVTLGKGTSMRYGLQVEARGPRRRYHRSEVDECCHSSIAHRHPFAKRERSFSPVKRRDPQVPQSHSKSSSRSRSQSSSSMNPCIRSRSKSPNFGSAVRMQRVRSSDRRPGLSVDHMRGFRTARRDHCSPHRNTRWAVDGKDSVFHFREQSYNTHSSLGRRSMGKFAQQDDRFVFADSSRSFRSVHPRRFMEMSGPGGRSLRYEESDDDRGKRRYRSGLAHSAKQNDMEGPVKRFRYNVADSYVSRYRNAPDFFGKDTPKCHGRIIDSQIGDIPGKFKEDRVPFTYQREAKYDVDSKSSGVQEGEDEMA
ncbi:uncharacterized protein LOC110609462 isoform X2 [Manihot esculenta]|uniref:Uncharacterized protein n=12 Tax=Manihot esculenta TaxID=3983 RepID=A0ACB7I4J9_MANES|nr:uncharacterized protein LOC110609462 isoform X2 [Manihot esculenta]XP_043809822.1 uncharacterized protein LOC110609462 isoform X2 [Manihot esculenta]KAG8659142.1 hypothetical protein MANES_02G019000v8 [Manihot esculenta]KAG8659143.1 hypothetical protein MANES_02G019000v8 [Manihot esculenta]KAG8659144.1 hypothetical protein MANES_02G019000v8 [Manihot esculenta]KAG8659145.1 hypothetical protein MANES_02G019000v8 [Manihot esculenta]KAG8659146.1 hypothetical protein MANES_02G019000v8 [Manihot 